MSRSNDDSLSAPLLGEDAVSAPADEEGVSTPPSSSSRPSPSAPPPPFGGDEAALEASAEAARRQCTDLIRDHLRHHLAQNPESAYVTWVATLHPENATVTLDPRFHIPGNPWLTVYEEAHRELREGRGGGGGEEGDGASWTGSEGGGGDDGPRPTNDVTRRSASDAAGTSNGAPRRTYSGCVDLAVAILLAMAGMASALGIEICALPIYACEVLCHRITSCCAPPNLCTILPFLPFWTLLQLLRLADALLLLASILVAELVAVAGMVLCAPLALSCSVGLAAHQRIRRLAHLTRWACRQCFGVGTPPRVTFGCSKNEEEGRCRQDGIDPEEPEA